jgi:hypothetical protein
MGSLTFAPPFCTDPVELRCHLGRFVRRLRHYRDGEPFAYVSVPELHKDGIKLHAHIALGFYIPKPRFQELWGHGWADIRMIRRPRGCSDIERARQSARYLSKYLGKAFDVSVFGRHRYEVGQGFKPQPERAIFDTEDEARSWLTERMGGATPSFEWSSSTVADWAGRPTTVAFWS